MAQSSPKKLPKGKTENYLAVPLSDKSTKSLLGGLSIASCNPGLGAEIVKSIQTNEDGK